MNRLTYIYLSAPLALALNNVPQLCPVGQWQLLSAAALAVGLWAVVWLRLYTNKRLRPEFSLLAVLPQAAFYGLYNLKQLSPEAAEPLVTSPFWSNMYFFLWCGACVAGIRALLAAPTEEARPAKNDPLFLLMSMLTFAFCIAAWAGTSPLLFTPSSL